MLKAIFSMVVVRGMTLVFPIALIPLQLKILGISLYGEYNVLIAISAIGSVFISYGFDYSISRNISRVESELKEICNIVTVVFYCKLINYLVILLFVFVYFYSVGKLDDFYVMAIFLFSQVLVPIYVFQGMKRMEYLIFNTLFLNVLFLLVLTVSLFSHVKLNSNEMFLIYAVINLIAAIQMVFYINKKLQIHVTKIKIMDVIYQYRNGGWIFFSRIMSTGLSQWSIIVLSSVLGPENLGVYTLADKLVRASNSFFYAIQQATYPYFCNRMEKSIFLKVTVTLFFLSIMAVILFYSMWGYVIYYFPILDNHLSSVLIMFFAIVPMSISGMLGVNFLLAKDYNKEFAFILALAAGYNISMLSMYISRDSLTDASMVLLSTEIIIAFFMVLMVLIKMRKYNGWQ
ncbi:oligosaccharide flippase family protein [Citrobacter freundii]|jgi:O-antigen/teichoic acid export membrane protein|uniref:oligosaccharide flippase family protein n=1 Tax=Citrobacter freundii TaxID=546 RepID=UPI0015EA3617|nr:oligosaccharide flippase family protein [Citrobacter freundii]QMB05662.1 oligosaccharide flippase family protein [Citrobacter freundii]